MKKIIYGSIFACACFMLLFFAPDVPSMIFVGAMTLLTSIGYGTGIVRINRFAEGFDISIRKIEELKKFSVEENWLYVKQLDSLFNNRYLDQQFGKFAKKVEHIKHENDYILPDVEKYINEDFLSLKSQKNFLQIIPGTLTGLGILGTFYGLISGLGSIHFSSVDVVVDSISSLVSGIDTAFYTSIAGITLSLVFEIISKISWNEMIVIMLDFYEKFHSKIIATEQEQIYSRQLEFYKNISTYLERDNYEKTKN